MTTIAGLATARGFASGPVFVYRGDGQVPVPEYLVERDRVDDELMRLKRAVVETKRARSGRPPTARASSSSA